MHYDAIFIQKTVKKNNRTSPYPALCVHGCIPMVESWPLCMNGATGRKSRHGPLYDKTAATKPKAPITLFHCCFPSGYFSNIRTNYSKICTSGSTVIECTCRDMKQSHPRVKRPTTLKNSREILHFSVNCCFGATSTSQYHPTYYKTVERFYSFNRRLLVQPKSQYWMLTTPMNSHDRCPVPGELLVWLLHALLQYQCEWYKDVNINFLFVRSNMRQWEITFTPQKIGRKYKVQN
jgi:hypothetical protein